MFIVIIFSILIFLFGYTSTHTQTLLNSWRRWQILEWNYLQTLWRFIDVLLTVQWILNIGKEYPSIMIAVNTQIHMVMINPLLPLYIVRCRSAASWGERVYNTCKFRENIDIVDTQSSPSMPPCLSSLPSRIKIAILIAIIEIIMIIVIIEMIVIIVNCRCKPPTQVRPSTKASQTSFLVSTGSLPSNS